MVTKTIRADLMSSYLAYSTADSRDTIERVMSYFGDNFDLRKRGDINKEVAIFKIGRADYDVLVDDEKPSEVERDIIIQIWVEQSGNLSMKDTKYDRIDDLADQVNDWALQLNASTVNMCTVTPVSISEVQERDGYLTVTVTLSGIIEF